MGLNYGYKRVSTEGQDTARQLVDLSVNLTTVYEDKLSGKNTNRPKLQECLNVLVSGDTLYVHSIDRLARNVEDLRDIVFKLMTKGVNVKFVKEGLEFSGDMDEGMKHALSKMLLTLLGAVAEFERTLINERSREGRDAALKRGVKFGRANPNYGTKAKKEGTVNIDKVIAERKQLAIECSEYVIPEIKKALTYIKRPTQAKVATFLNDMKVPMPSGKGVWTQSKLQRVLDRHNINLFSL